MVRVFSHASSSRFRRLAAALLLLTGLHAGSHSSILARSHASDAPDEAEAATKSTPPLSQPSLQSLIDQLGAADYQTREKATGALIGMGESITPELLEAERAANDPEVRARLRFVQDNVSPPSEAVMALRSTDDGQLLAGDLITHLDGRRVRDASGLFARLTETASGAMLRIRRGMTPMDVGPLHAEQLPRLVDYRLPQGAQIRAALKWYRDGYAERAWELLKQLDSVEESELPDALRAIVAYTAGEAETAERLFKAEAMTPAEGNVYWTNLSGMDRAGPLRAPYRFEVLWSEKGLMTGPTGAEPDMLVQRVFIPAGRLVYSLRFAADQWWSRYRDQLYKAADTNIDRIAGNMIAIVAWMLSALDLKSECIQLIEPRSKLLGSKWVRVQSDAWPELLAGNPTAAIDRFWEDARAILDNPGNVGERVMLTRNPDVAATVGLFLYQAPADPRISQMLELVARPEFPVRDEFLQWTLFALNARNEARIRQDLAGLLPLLDGQEAQRVAWALALLSYIRDTDDAGLVSSARERIAQSRDAARRAVLLPAIEALIDLRAGRPDDALNRLAEADAPGKAVLLHTARFYKRFQAEALPALAARPLLAVPRDALGDNWILITRERRLATFNAAAGTLTALPPPTPDWFPGVVNWPWLGRDENSDRVWVYDRRRLIELGRAPGTGLALNTSWQQIERFDQQIAPQFGVFADAVMAVPSSGGECGEFMRDQVRAYQDYVADPDLHELSVIEPIAPHAHLLQVGVRGGPQAILDTQAGKLWTGQWMAEKLHFDHPPLFFPQAMPDGSPTLYLMSDQGLIRFDWRSETLQRLPLPAEPQYPFLIPESCPYARRDPRWIYFARLADESGQVFRLETASGRIELLTGMTNYVLPDSFYRMQTRTRLREWVDAAIAELGVPSLAAFIADARETVNADPNGLRAGP